MKSTLAIAMTVLVVSGLAHWARADQNPTTDDVVNLFPYTGTLERDGVALSGPLEMQFALYDGAEVSGTPLWLETQTVEVYAGRFTALLGLCDQSPGATACPDGDDDPMTSIEDVIRYADDLQLGVELFPDLVRVPLQSRKRFLPVPYAIWTRAATDLAVARDLGVGRNASVGQDLGVTRNATVGGSLTVNGPVRVGGGGDLSCPNDSRTTLGQCWWHISGYDKTYFAAARACVAQGGRLCSVAEMAALYAAGAHNCSYGWMADRVDATRMYAGFPLQTTIPGCGAAGFNLEVRSASDGLGAQCCK
jgi:hypothetical protein